MHAAMTSSVADNRTDLLAIVRPPCVIPVQRTPGVMSMGTK